MAICGRIVMTVMTALIHVFFGTTNGMVMVIISMMIPMKFSIVLLHGRSSFYMEVGDVVS
jgi:hypothetical protein